MVRVSGLQLGGLWWHARQSISDGSVAYWSSGAKVHPLNRLSRIIAKPSMFPLYARGFARTAWLIAASLTVASPVGNPPRHAASPAVGEGAILDNLGIKEVATERRLWTKEILKNDPGTKKARPITDDNLGHEFWYH